MIVTKNSLTLSNVNDGTITHYAYAYSADGTDRFTTVYPNLNLLTGTRDFSGAWIYGDVWATDGTYNGLTVKKRTGQWVGIHKVFIAPKDGTYTFSAYIKSSGDNANIYRFGGINTAYPQDAIQKFIGNNFDWTKDTVTLNLKANDTAFIRYEISGESSDLILWTAGHKWEDGSIATPHMPSASEVISSDWPSYIGQYTDFSTTASTDPAKYAPWIIFKGNDGDMGKSVWSYQYDRGANRLGSWWSDLKPTPTTDNPPKVGDTIIDLVGSIYQITNVVVGTAQQGGGLFDYGPMLTSVKGADGDPGKIVSDTEPISLFTGLTWKYSGTTDLTASDGTVIKPNTEYYYNGTHWMINYLSANNLEANSITADLIDAKNLTITDGEFVSTIIDGPVQTQTEIKDDHLLIYKMDTSTNSINTIALKSDSGLAMTYQNSDTGEYTSAGVNFQGLFMQNNITNEFARLTPQGTKLSTDVPWTDITRASGVGTSGTLRARINNGVFYAQSKDVTIPSIAPNSLITIGTLSSKFSGVSGFDTLGLLYSPGQFSVASVSVGSDLKINIGNPNPTTMSGKVIQFSINIPLG
jgi:hypothetical protein